MTVGNKNGLLVPNSTTDQVRGAQRVVCARLRVALCCAVLAGALGCA
jgi:hypothetical protein